MYESIPHLITQPPDTASTVTLRGWPGFWASGASAKKGFFSYFCSYLYLCCCCFLSQGHPCPWEGGHQQHKHFRKTSSRLSTNMYIGVHVYTSCECDTHTHKLS